MGCVVMDFVVMYCVLLDCIVMDCVAFAVGVLLALLSVFNYLKL